MKLGKIWSTLLCMATLGLAGCGGSRPDGLGLTNGQLAPCPDSPNCVSSQAESDYHSMAPIPLTVPAAQAQDVLIGVLDEMEEIEVVSVEPGYIYAEATSPRMGFVDDVELALDEDTGAIHFRSASRLGYGDMGANRARMEEISERFAAALPEQTGQKAASMATRSPAFVGS